MMARGLVAVALGAAARALALAIVAGALSGVEAAAWPAFLAFWALALLPVFFVTTLFEVPLVGAALGPEPRRDARAVLAGAVTGAVAAFLLETYVPLVRALGWPGVAALAGAGAAATLALPPAGRPGPWVALAVVPWTALALWDPEARYAERYSENRAAAPYQGAPLPAAMRDIEVARALARGFMRAHPPERLRWSWEETVAVEGLLAYARAASDPEPIDYARRWVAAHADEALGAPLWADACAGAMVALAIGERPEIVARVERYLRHDAPRTRAGAMSHPGLLLGGALPRQAWVDSLFMHGIFLDRLAEQSGDEWARAEAAWLARGIMADLRDPASGFFRHAAIDLGPIAVRLPIERTFWARGNAWAAYFLVDHDSRDADLVAARDALLRAIVAAQDPETGLWPTDLGAAASPENPLETSASALFVAALRRQGGHEAAARRGLVALRSRVLFRDGLATAGGTSIATHPGFRAYYRSVPLDVGVGHGVGATLLALCAQPGTP